MEVLAQLKAIKEVKNFLFKSMDKTDFEKRKEIFINVYNYIDGLIEQRCDCDSISDGSLNLEEILEDEYYRILDEIDMINDL